MESQNLTDLDIKSASPKKRGLFGRFCRAKGGSAAIEFAILVIPFFMIIFATVETFVAYNAEQVVSGAVDTLARKVRTGQITFAMGRPTDKTKTEFRALFCAEIAVMITCDSTEAATPKRLLIDLRSFTSYSSMPKTIPFTAGDVDSSAFVYSPGGPGSLHMLRAAYKWEIMTDLMRPYLTNIKPSGVVPKDYLIVSTAAFKSESYP